VKASGVSYASGVSDASGVEFASGLLIVPTSRSGNDSQVLLGALQYPVLRGHST
jgi:hypothetical protein